MPPNTEKIQRATVVQEERERHPGERDIWVDRVPIVDSHSKDKGSEVGFVAKGSEKEVNVSVPAEVDFEKEVESAAGEPGGTDEGGCAPGGVDELDGGLVVAGIDDLFTDVDR